MKPQKKNRSRAYYRQQRRRVIRRKMNIVGWLDWHVPFEGWCAKGKIHCSCELCRAKTREEGLPHSQKKQWQCLGQQLADYVRGKEL